MCWELGLSGLWVECENALHGMYADTKGSAGQLCITRPRTQRVLSEEMAEGGGGDAQEEERGVGRSRGPTGGS